MTQPTIIGEGEAVERPAGDVASDVRKDLASMNARIDDIVAFQERKRPWYRDTSLLISGAAFLFPWQLAEYLLTEPTNRKKRRIDR
jgi:hypothetical protein